MKLLGFGVGFGWRRRYSAFPHWLARASDGTLPLFDADFANGRYYYNGRVYKTFDAWLAALGGTFARTSTATRITAAGLYETVATGVPRFDHTSAGTPLGIYIEGARTNKVTAAKSNPTATTNITKDGDPAAVLSVVNDSAALATAGLSAFGPNVYKLDNSLGGAVSRIVFAGVPGNTNPHSASVFIRGTGSAEVMLQSASDSMGALTSTYRRSKAEGKTPVSTTDPASIRIAPGSVVYFILPQLVEAAFVSSPIPGGTGAITRAADMLTAGPTGGVPFVGWNQNEGTLITRGRTPPGVSTPAFQYMASFDDSTVNNLLFSGRQVDRAMKGQILTGSVTVSDIVRAVVADNTTLALAHAWKLNDCAVSLNGGAVGVDTSVPMPPVTRMIIGDRSGADRSWYSTLSRVTYFAKRLTNADLQTLST